MHSLLQGRRGLSLVVGLLLVVGVSLCLVAIQTTLCRFSERPAIRPSARWIVLSRGFHLVPRLCLSQGNPLEHQPIGYRLLVCGQGARFLTGCLSTFLFLLGELRVLSCFVLRTPPCSGWLDLCQHTLAILRVICQKGFRVGILVGPPPKCPRGF